PLQVVHKKESIDFDNFFKSIDLRGLSRSEQENHIENYCQEDQTKGFDLAKLPLIRFALFDLGENGYELLQSNHHILKDGWSFGVLYKELIELYEDEAILLPIT
ncbi:condensation domain-containing protein, partial [Acinetobacter baumannii]|uniref:condensation domain-containing protein n=1 Tax=Acinetobacter baumannii TaxID=470 RepID=UPI000E14CF56